MKFTLEPYQSSAVESVLTNLAKARAGYLDDGERTAVGLTAPTGAGKTVIATAVLEGIYKGTSIRAANPNMTVLWITDDRALNAQTIAKITQASGGAIDINRIRFIAEDDHRTLQQGHIYFVHIQAMQKNSTLHAVRADGTPNDKRTHGAWDMIANTVRERGEDFLVIWDEAHRGSGTKNTDRKSIAGTIVDGGTTNIGTNQPPAPVVLGISATPDRFLAAMNAANRTPRLVEVKAGDVRESGLLKDRILLRSLGESQSADNTMLALAVEDLRSSDASWRSHHEATGDRLVEPLLVVQVEQGLSPAKEEARLAEILAVMESTWPKLSDYAIAHAFGDHAQYKVGDKTIRYLPPEAISGDDQARVVLFKSALTTGWDCPRAEVMISFQNKDSYTEIAQLIGRLVRTPLAKRIEGGRRATGGGGGLPARVPNRARGASSERADRRRDCRDRYRHRPRPMREIDSCSPGVVRPAGHASLVHQTEDIVRFPHRAVDATGRNAHGAWSDRSRLGQGQAMDRRSDARGRQSAKQRDRRQGRRHHVAVHQYDDGLLRRINHAECR